MKKKGRNRRAAVPRFSFLANLWHVFSVCVSSRNWNECWPIKKIKTGLQLLWPASPFPSLTLTLTMCVWPIGIEN